MDTPGSPLTFLSLQAGARVSCGAHLTRQQWLQARRAYGLREWRRAPVLAALEQLAASAPWPRVSTLEQLERAFEAWKTAVTPSLTATRIHPPPAPLSNGDPGLATGRVRVQAQSQITRHRPARSHNSHTHSDSLSSLSGCDSRVRTACGASACG